MLGILYWRIKIRAMHSELSSRVSSRNESGRVRKKLEKLVPTLIFEKQQFPKLAKTKISEKTV